MHKYSKYILVLPVFISLFASCLLLLGCGGESSPTLLYDFPIPTDLTIKGNINLADIAVRKELGGTDGALLDHSVFQITIQDNPTLSVSVDQAGRFELPPINITDQVVLLCKNKEHSGFTLEWMAADSSGLYGNKEISISVKSTARSLIARSLRDRYGRRIKPETLGAEHISTTVNAIAKVIEQHPEKISSLSFEKVPEVLSAYASMTVLLDAGGSGSIPNEWVYMIYMGGDNDLYSYLNANLNDIAEVGNIEKSVILVQADIFDTGMKRFWLKDGKITELASVGNVDSSDPMYIADFVAWSRRTFPASHYALILSSHADAWKGNSSRNSFIIDQSSGNIGNPVAIAAWLTGANTLFDGFYRKLDLLGFDACFMGMIEIAWEYRNISNYTVFSQARVPSYGFPYRKIFSALKTTASSSLTGENLAKLICETYAQEYINGIIETSVAISAIKNEALPSFLGVLSKYISALYSNKEALVNVIPSLRDSTLSSNASTTKYVVQSFESPDYRDLKDFIMEGKTAMQQVKIEADILLNEYNNVIIQNKYSNKYYPDASGLSISLPTSTTYNSFYLASGTALYGSYNFAQQTLWDELLGYINTAK